MAEVRYYSRSDKTREVAEQIAEAIGVDAVSVDSQGAEIDEPTDVLFVGGALYAYGLDKKLNAFIEALDGEKVKKAVLFSTSWISKHALDLMREKLVAKGIQVADDVLYLKSREVKTHHTEIQNFAKKYI